MSKTLLLLLGLALCFIQCSNELDEYDPRYIGENAKKVLVVYGLISADDSLATHYIRVARAFQTKGDRVVYAKETDLSLANAIVYLQPLHSINSQGDTLWGSPIRCTSERITRSTTNFYPSITVYKVQFTPRVGQTYKLVVKVSENERVDSVYAVTTIPEVPYITSPGEPVVLPGNRLAWPEAPFQQSNFSLRMRRSRSSCAPRNAGAGFELSFHFIYRENDKLDTLTFQYATPFAESNTTCSLADCFCIQSGKDFQSFLLSQLEGKTNLRYDDSDQSKAVGITVRALDKALYNYMRANNPAFIDFTTVRPEYTNIHGGVGVFGSYSSFTRYVRLSPCTQHLLQLNGKRYEDRPVNCEK
ncbi:MAG: DUF4249 family protein [Bacteroidia bacterium]|nr:DUF4249 domain-containing protein [Bacteroidia bacterium]MDW8159475.1 DUF4249 family protein [Bacteroidia bacterium]